MEHPPYFLSPGLHSVRLLLAQIRGYREINGLLQTPSS